MAHSHLARSA